MGSWRHPLFYLLLATVATLLLLLGQRYPFHWDWSENRRNTLNPQTQALLASLSKPLKVTAFVPDYPLQRAAIRELLEKCRRHHWQLRFDFVDPSREPELARELGIHRTPQLLVEYDGRQEILDTLSEEALSNALARLNLEQNLWITGIQGHGEAKLRGSANHDLGDFGKLLEQKGYPLFNLDLTATGQIPDNTRLLVLAAPRSIMSDKEIDTLIRYLNGGGNLLWLADGELPRALADYLGLHYLPGTLVDAAAADLGIDTPTIAVGRPAAAHALTDSLNAPVLLPHARAADAANQRWQPTPLLRTGARSWNETGDLKGVIQRDGAAGERRGPLTLAWLLERKLADRKQQVVVVGDADFLSNAFIGNGANRAFGLGLIHWLSRQTTLVSIPPTQARDQQLHWSATTMAAAAGLFLMLIPAVLGVAGILIPWWRRRA